MKLICILIILLVNYCVNNQQFYKKVVHNIDPQAKCLDGSPGFLYLHEGTQKDKFLLYFLGGGFCGQTTLSATIQSCYQRSKTQFGTSTVWPDILTDSMGAQGLISLDNETIYRNWTKVIFGYCDGAIHQGGNDNPIQYKNTKLYFRGNRIVRSHFKYLIQNYQLNQASKIIISGSSAGGMASIMWGNYLHSIVKDVNSIYNVPDSGIFINSTTFTDNTTLIQTQISTLMKIAQVSQKSPIQQCNKNNAGYQWKCLFIQQNYKYLKGKHLFINSQYDQWAINFILKIKCIQQGVSGYTLKNCPENQLQAIQSYRTRYLKFINENIKPKGWGIWSIGCSQHVYQMYKGFYDSNLQRVPTKSGMTVKDAMERFVMENKVEWTVDEKGWPNNEPCAY